MEPYERSGLIVPVVLWGRKSPQIRVSHVCSIRNGQVVVTGTTDGHVVQWTVDEALGWVQPDVVLIAHDAAISCVAPASDAGSSTRYVTCSEDGQICLWDSVDGRAVDSTQHQYIHRRIVPYWYRMSSHHFQIRLLCVGDYAEILVVDGHDLNVLFSLSSRVEPDWINTLTVVHADRSDVVIGVSRSSMIKLWSLADLDKKDASTIIYEDESKMLNARNVVDPSTLNQLVVSECAIEAISGVVVDVDRIAVGFADATVVLFQLPRSKLCGKQVTDRFGENPTNIGNVDQPFVFALLKGFPLPPTMPVLNTANFFFEYRAVDKRGRFWAYRTDHQGNVSVWHVPKNYDVLVEEFIRSRRPVAYEPNIRQSFAGFWDRLSPKPPSVYNEDERTVTATVFVGSQGKLLLGRDDGTIVMMYACHAIAAQLLESSSSEPVHQRVLSGHSMAVTCFLYPFEESNRYDPQLLLSGGDDFAVIVWNLTTGTKVFRFCCQGGPIQRLLVPPDNCNPRVLHTICSVAADNSVALLSLKENKCVLLASRQQYPVVDVRWRPLDDFMLVRCEDDSVYVWQMETANLDRIVAGVLADDVMEACKEQIGVVD
ncbi:CBR-RBC-2 protein, partial [Aphelenchoides avenae]